MLNSTRQIVAEHPVALLPLLFTAWVVYRLLRRNRTKVLFIVGGISTILVAPVFLFTFLAEFTGVSLFSKLSAFSIRVESLLIGFLFQFVDAVLAAELQLFVLLMSGLWDSLQGLATPVVPVIETVGLHLILFTFEFVAGVILIYTLYLSSHGSELDSWLKGIGVVLAITGMFATFIQFDTWQARESLLASAFTAAMLGLTLGISSVILLVRPNFGGESVFSELRESDSPQGASEEDTRENWTAKAMSRMDRLVSRRKE
ncbi:hypothetical protein SAMN05421858_3155 [Haladaptatus litoreus]|uniref:Uncharacterized protein n=1 Tax=Haladaptatus litoreus TaxID=553468 RepID=A0A1N7CPY5_9EURY|nr:hypothetical protein [Haladaptatus litoreus]SIR65504.1 hypothetical protein SAMN05421858_3155 [Haladaptatus litoreus]